MDVVAQDAKSSEGKKQGSFWRELPVLIVIALILALIIKTFAIQAFYIPSESMENTLLKDDRVLVNKIVYHMRDIERGDIVVFSGVDSWDGEIQLEEPSNPIAGFLRSIATAFGVAPGEKDYIKRVVGVAGDTVKCCDAEGRVSVNGIPLNEKGYLYPGNEPSIKAFEKKVPPGHLWVMGDHRAVSLDSREHLQDPGGGAIPADKVIGRAFVIVWPVSRWGSLPIPETFSQPGLAAAGPAVPEPLMLGFVGAVPLALLRRRRRRS